jgi:hypothetical protein
MVGGSTLVLVLGGEKVALSAMKMLDMGTVSRIAE